MPANSAAEGNAVSVLRDLRDSIDNIDAAIIHMLAERFRCTQRVGVLDAAGFCDTILSSILLDLAFCETSRAPA